MSDTNWHTHPSPSPTEASWEAGFVMNWHSDFCLSNETDSNDDCTCSLVSFISKRIAQAERRGIEMALEALPKKEESDGWDVFFAKKGVEPCCPGDDIAAGWNLAKDEIRSLLIPTDPAV